MQLSALAAVGVGAALGAWVRWGLGAALNALVPNLPLGTLMANLAGGYLVGVAVAQFDQVAGLPPEARLFVITGFLGALTTFSTFSAESVSLLQSGRYGWAFAHAGAHLFGSLAMTVLGLETVRLLRG
ncbi:MAG: fluoride efflux transporter CrcB [Burkholderiales bacterium]|nr:fluoride efflux transporter CrcB [Burkholderiales bacterium]